MLSTIKSSPSTPNRKRRVSTRDNHANTPPLVTPSTHDENELEAEIVNRSSKARRQLSMPALKEKEGFDNISEEESEQVTKTCFGRVVTNDAAISHVQSNTRQVYALVNKMTGSIGGNGHGGAIYGELTVGSMQKMIELMKIHTNLGPDSRFIDVGSGLGKPNLHVTQDPAVEFSYGIEMEQVRWMLGMSNLKVVLESAVYQKSSESDDTNQLQETEKLHSQCVFAHGDITEANYFDPFTHVYMFDIGFPPKLFKELGRMFNRSQSEYLICYHGPKLMVERYGFNVELIIQAPTSMHGSSEGHMGYIYRRVGKKQKIPKGLEILNGVPCDPLFANAWKSTKRDVKVIYEDVKKQVSDSLNSQRPKRKRTRNCYMK